MIKYVPMNASDVATADEEFHYVGTNGLESCAGIAIYDFSRNVVGASHVYFDENGFELDSCGNNVFRDFSGFREKAREVIALCNEKGGSVYEFSVFNIDNGRRRGTPKLKSVVEATIEELKKERLIERHQYRNETGFIINARTGLIRPF